MSEQQPVPERGRGPILPSRYEEVMNQRIANEAGRLATQVQAGNRGAGLQNWGVPVAVVGLGLAGVFMLLGRSEAGSPPGSVPFDRSVVISSGSTGSRASAEDLIPPKASPAPTAAVPAADFAAKASNLQGRELHVHPTPAPRRVTRQPKAQPNPIPSEAPCPTCEREVVEATKAREQAQAGISPNAAEGTGAATQPTPAPPVAPEQARTLMNVGSRFDVTLTFPVNTAFAGAPVNATLAKDMVDAGGRLVMPAGTLLVGEAFATQVDDRAQIIFTAIVRDGRTTPFRGIAVGGDAQLGVPGRVVRKASAAKKGAGRVLGSIGQALSFGLVGRGDGVLGDAGAILANETASDLSQLDRAWSLQRSDKVLEVKAGTTVTVYVQSDVRVSGAGHP
jgi:hypothetical protein